MSITKDINVGRSSRRRNQDSAVTSNIQTALSVFDSILQATVYASSESLNADELFPLLIVFGSA